MTINQDYITSNKYSRPGIRLKKIKGIVIHWTANPNTSAKANRDFFETRKLGKKGYGSAQYIIGLDGEIIHCIPDDEMAYHVGAKKYKTKAKLELSTYPNNCTLGIECTIINKNGLMTTKTYNTLIELVCYLLIDLHLNEDNLYLHYDITGKKCHKWFVDKPEQWQKFKSQIKEKLWNL